MKRSDTKPLGCGICPYKTNSACHLERHLRIHTGQKPYACEMCSYRATDGGLLKRHMRIHSGEKPFTCQICGHKTAQSCSLKDHMAVHTGKKRYACDICPFQCSRIGRLRDHQLQHKVLSVKKEPTPDQLDQAADQIYDGDQHVSDSKSSTKCPTCDLEFPGVPNLNRHIASAHPKPQNDQPESRSLGTSTDLQYNCGLCSASVDSLSALNAHFTRHILYRCIECDSTFETPDGLVAHNPAHSEELIFNCNKCDFKSKTRNELRGHERAHNSIQPLICTECNFVSKSSTEFAQHLQTHTSTEMVQCNICSTKFSKTSELREHMVVHYSRSRPRITRKQTTTTEPNNVESFHCYYCSFKSSEESQMTKHIQEHVTPSMTSEKYGNIYGQHEINITVKGEPNDSVDEAKLTKHRSLIPESIAQIDSTKSGSTHTLPSSKAVEYNHCPCNYLGLRWLKNPECNYQLTHFMNPNDTEFSDMPFHCGKCRTFIKPDDHQNNKTIVIKTANKSQSRGNNDDDSHYKKSKIEKGFMTMDESSNLSGLDITARLTNKRSSDDEKQKDIINSDQDRIESQTDMKKLKIGVESSRGTNYLLNEQNSKNHDPPTSAEEKCNNAEILLSKLRQFFNETFPKSSPVEVGGEDGSDQSTLTAHSSTHDLLTIELSSDSNASYHSY